MNAQRLLAEFERMSEAPDAIPRLRRFILDLAVRGKLVEQDPEDVPAEELLKEIQARFRTLRITKKLVPLETKEIPFALPDRWQWTRLGEICEKTGSGSTPRGGKEAYSETGIPFLRSQNIYNDGLRLADVVFIDTKTHGRMTGTRVLPCDLLLNITGGSIGRCAKVPVDFEEANVSQHVAIIRVALPGMEDFLHLLVLSPYFQSFVESSQTGAGRGGLPKNRMDAIPVALPTLAVQHRIVAKVDELIALCDRLEAARQERMQGQQRLVAACLQRLNQPAEDPETFRQQAGFALQVLPRLTTSAAEIKQLRQTILNLAVRGKLVAQDPEDEPAGELLRVFAQHKYHLELAREIPRAKLLPEVDANDFSQTPGWIFVGLGRVSTQITKGSTPTSYGHPFTNDGVSFIKIESIKDGRLHADAITSFISSETHGFLSRSLLQAGDILFSIAGSIGTCALVEEKILPANTNQALAIIRGTGMLVAPDFLILALRSSFAQSILIRARGGAMNNVSLGDVQNLVVPLPPLAEQHRIVAKVEQLMALCDQLEQQLNAGEQLSRKLLEAVLQEALAEPEKMLTSAVKASAP